jgi:signal transduction histidine kinase/ligand-binding sensor domain-containing protein
LKNRLNTFVILIFLFGGLQTLHAQLNPENLTHYTEMDGNNIFDVLADQFGNIWMTTHNGLTRFDGYEFTRFYNDPNNSTSISDILVSSLFEDSKGRIWVGGMDDVNVYDPKTNTFRSYPFDHLTGVTESSQPWIDTITEDLSGRIYFGASDFFGQRLTNSLFFLDEHTETIQIADSPGIGSISNINQSTTDPFGNSWFIGRSGIIRISPDGVLQAMALPEGTDTSDYLADRFTIASDMDGLIWITFASSTIHIYDPDTWHYEMLDLSDIPGLNTRDLMINKIHFDNKNIVWLATSAGIIQYNRESGEWLTFANDGNNRISDLDIIAFDTDSFGNLWMGTWQAGLLKYENQRIFNSYRGDIQTPQKISNGWVKRIIESDDGSVWLSTTGATSSDGGINKIDFGNESITTITYDELRAGWFFSSDFTEVSPGVFYTSNASGLFRLEVSTMELNDVDTKGLQDGSLIEKYYRDHNGTEWLGTYNGLYKRKVGQPEYTLHDLSTQPGGNHKSNEVMNFVPDSTTGLWLLTNYGLFYYRYDTERIERHAYDPDLDNILASQDINSLYVDDDGIVWVGTWGGGLSRYDTTTGQIKTYTMADGLPSMGIQYILKDTENNDLWMSTFDGISRFDIDTGLFVNYTMENGLHSQLFTDGSGLKTSDGLFIFGGSNGITFFRPSEVSKSSPPPRMYFTDLKIDDVSHSFGNGIFNADQIELAHHQNTISIDYTGIHYSNPARNRFSYILENYDTGWRDVGLQRTAYYPNLPPGNYVFRVKAANSNGVWNEEGISMNIVVSPPWWKTIWAYLLYGFLFAGAVYGIDRSQRRRLVRQERERAREKELAQAKEIEKAYNDLEKAHQNLETAHSNLKAAQDQLVQQEKLASLGQLTAGIAHEIKNPLNFVNNFSDVSLEMIDEALEELAKTSQDDHTAETAAILADIKSNLAKIHEHGTRADGIVKSMLMHSRGGSGKMEPTNLNELVKEYVNLSYHGMRAGQNSVEVDIELNLDESIGEVPLVAEDFSRVILNLCTNAFDACTEQSRSVLALGSSENPPQSPGGSFESLPQSGSPRRVPPPKPRLTVRTTKNTDTVHIEIEDNGPGIPDEIKDKILQPFFTTKKGTQGTGLGLSITNDIIKAHGGELIIKSGTFGTVMTIKLHLPN